MNLDPDQSAGTPLWAYVTAIAVLVLAVAFVLMHLASGGPVGH